MKEPRNLPKMIGAFVLLIFLLVFYGCQSLEPGSDKQLGIATESTPTSDSTQPKKTPTPDPTSTPIPTATSTVKPTPTKPTSTPIEFPDDIYLPPLPLQFGAWPATSGCPNHEGLQETDELPKDVVYYEAGELLFTGNHLREKAVSDPALWPLLPFSDRTESTGQGKIDESWIDSIQKVDQSEYAKLVLNQCGLEITGISWVAKICPGPCASTSFESLKDDLFFVNRNGTWLIWAIY